MSPWAAGSDPARAARSKREFAEAIERLLGESRFRERAAAFAEKYRGFDPDQVSARAVEVIERVLEGRATAGPAD